MHKEYGIREHIIRFFKSILWSGLILYALYLAYNYIHLLQYNINVGTLRNATQTNSIWIVATWLLSGFAYVLILDADVDNKLSHGVTFDIFNSVCVLIVYYFLTLNTEPHYEYYSYLKILPILISWLISEFAYIAHKILALINEDIYESDFIDCIKYRVISLGVLLGLILLLFI